MSKKEILAAFERRVNNDRDTELETALAEVERIALLRLQGLLAVSRPLGANVMTHLHELARCSSEPGRLTRLYLTPAHAAAIGMVRGWMEEAGMSVEVDAAANLVGRYAGERPGCRRSCSARTSTRSATPATMTAISAWSPRSRPWQPCTPPASACPSRSR